MIVLAVLLLLVFLAIPLADRYLPWPDDQEDREADERAAYEALYGRDAW